ncbi:cytidine deaminase-like protein [Aspergillus carlsbadensis]|nr:cytidine deaminase-like protein [Aspergillus carlsbadensis]
MFSPKLTGAILTVLALFDTQITAHDIQSIQAPTNNTLHPQIAIPAYTDTDTDTPTADHRDSHETEVPLTVRTHWMRQTFHALNASGSPCPLYPFAAVIVNHTTTDTNTGTNTNNSGDFGELICTGVNQGRQTGNMLLHGEISALLNCTEILQDPAGKYRLSPAETIDAFRHLSLYTNAESCPMCASALRWNGFREYIYGTSIARLVEYGFAQITIPSREVFARAQGLPSETALIAGVLAEETDALFAWQFRDGGCPVGCSRVGGGEGRCEPV